MHLQCVQKAQTVSRQRSFDTILSTECLLEIERQLFEVINTTYARLVSSCTITPVPEERHHTSSSTTQQMRRSVSCSSGVRHERTSLFTHSAESQLVTNEIPAASYKRQRTGRSPGRQQLEMNSK